MRDRYGARADHTGRYPRSILVPPDETCVVPLQARSAKATCEAARRTALRFERLAEAIDDRKREVEPVVERMQSEGRETT